jgi:alpha-tubulin suppressor-like RCC1 family protein
VFPVPQRVSVGIPLRCTQVACGRKHCLALMEGGFVMSWGEHETTQQ